MGSDPIYLSQENSIAAGRIHECVGIALRECLAADDWCIEAQDLTSANEQEEADEDGPAAGRLHESTRLRWRRPARTESDRRGEGDGEKEERMPQRADSSDLHER